MKISNIIAATLIALAATCLTGCVTPVVLIVRSQPASGTYETDATVATIESAAAKLALELEAADMAESADKAFAYRYSAHPNATRKKTRVDVNVNYVGSWTRTGFITPSEKLELFVKGLAGRTGAVLTPIAHPNS